MRKHLTAKRERLLADPKKRAEFERWLDEHFPERKEKILSRIRAIRGGDRLSDPRWGTRIKGEGIFAEQIATLFQMSCRKMGIGPRPELSTEHFRRTSEQLTLL